MKTISTQIPALAALLIFVCTGCEPVSSYSNAAVSVDKSVEIEQLQAEIESANTTIKSEKRQNEQLTAQLKIANSKNELLLSNLGDIQKRFDLFTAKISAINEESATLQQTIDRSLDPVDDDTERGNQAENPKATDPKHE